MRTSRADFSFRLQSRVIVVEAVSPRAMQWSIGNYDMTKKTFPSENFVNFLQAADAEGLRVVSGPPPERLWDFEDQMEAVRQVQAARPGDDAQALLEKLIELRGDAVDSPDPRSKRIAKVTIEREIVEVIRRTAPGRETTRTPPANIGISRASKIRRMLRVLDFTLLRVAGSILLAIHLSRLISSVV
jgi:hypothetical protein